MTPIQRRACLALSGVTLSRFSPRHFRYAVVELAQSDRWPAVELSAKQVALLARTVRKYRRQIGDANLLFWAQRVLAEGSIDSKLEEPCQPR